MPNVFHTLAEMQELIAGYGFLPFFGNDIPMFSVAEHTPSELWFSDETDGPWEWKGPAIIEGGFAYGKFFDKKAGFITMDWFPDFLNYRRHQYELTVQEDEILATIKSHGSLLTKEIKKLCGYQKPRIRYSNNPMLKESEKQTAKLRAAEKKKHKKEGFDTAITRLQMSANIVVADFEYNYDKEGKRYGWGVARYCTPEDFFGEEAFTEALRRTPDESYERMMAYLRQRLTWTDEEKIRKILG